MAPLIARGLEEYFNDEIRIRVAPVQERDYKYPMAYAPAHDMHIRREYAACMEQVMMNERLRHNEKQREFKARWAAAAKTFQTIDETIALINKPYMESKHEIERCTALLGKQKEALAERSRHALGLLRQKCYLSDVKAQTLERLKKFTAVRDYLSKVVEASHGEFQGIKELIDRADLLLETRADLISRNERLLEKIARREKELSSMSIVNENSGILLNNYIADVTNDLAQAKEVCHRLESDVAHVKNTAHRRTVVLSQMRTGTHNIYSQINTSFNRPQRLRSSDVIGQLEYIKGTLLEINKIRITLNEMLAKEKNERQRVAWMEEKHRRVWGRWQKGVRDVSVAHERDTQNKRRTAFGMRTIETDKKLSLPSVTKMVIKYLNPKP